MKLRNLIIAFILALSESLVFAQSFKEQYEQFKNNAQNYYSSFRDECNHRYINFLAEAWDWYDGKAPIPMPKDEFPVPPKPYIGENNMSHIDTKPVEIDPIDVRPQPKPIEPIREIPTLDEDYFTLKFYDQECKIRLPKFAKLSLNDCQPNSIASGWESLCNEGMNNAIHCCPKEILIIRYK